MYKEIYKLEYKINQMKKILVNVVEETGLKSKYTLYYSQKLDEVLVRYQKLKMKIQKFD